MRVPASRREEQPETEKVVPEKNSSSWQRNKGVGQSGEKNHDAKQVQARERSTNRSGITEPAQNLWEEGDKQLASSAPQVNHHLPHVQT